MKLFKTILVGLFILILATRLAWVYGTYEKVTITVDSKERVSYDNGHKFLVFTRNETFENTDALMYFKFNSADMYGKLTEGKTFVVGTYGFRMPLFNEYRNITSITPIN